jgi:hypothetical protein
MYGDLELGLWAMTPAQSAKDNKIRALPSMQPKEFMD